MFVEEGDDAVEFLLVLEVDHHAALSFDVAFHLDLGVQGLRKGLDLGLEVVGQVVGLLVRLPGVFRARLR